MAPFFAQLKKLVRHGKKKRKDPIQTRDSGTSLSTHSPSPSHPHSRSLSASQPTGGSPTSIAKHLPPPRPATPPRLNTAPTIDPVQMHYPLDLNSTKYSHNDSNTLHDLSLANDPQAPSSKHASPTPISMENPLPSPHSMDLGQVAPAATTIAHSSSSNTIAAFGQNNNTETASRMVAEEREQRRRLPVYEGLERYTLLEKMGDGAFSNVYRAHDTKMDRLVAIKAVRKYDMSAQNKHLHRDMKKKPRVTERANILKEVQIMRQLKHPGIIELYDFSESEEFYFLVLELAPGGELFHRIVKLTYFSEELTRHVIVQVAHAIRYLHEEKGVIHRDIKPENILFEPIPIIPSSHGFKPPEEEKEDEGIFQPGIGGGGIGRVKIADFGLSKVVWDEQTMTPCGTVGYTAPEIVKDERYSKSVDMWALGCVLYTLLCGFPPFYDESIQALTEKVARGQYTFLSPWWDDISTQAKDLITHLLCVNPNERYTIDEFLAHPWVKAGDVPMVGQTPYAGPGPEISIASPPATTPAIENKLLSAVAAMTPDYGAPRTPYRRRAENPLSPGIGLKEVFDVSNAVHRMEEESRRRHVQQQGAGMGLSPADARQRQAFMNHLNEEDLIEEEEEESGSGMSEDEVMAAGMSDVRLYNNTMNPNQPHHHNNDPRVMLQQRDYQRAQEEMAAEKQRELLKRQQEAGYAIPSTVVGAVNGAMRKHHHMEAPYGSQHRSKNQASGAPYGAVISAMGPPTQNSSSATSGASSRRRRAGFDLNINQATLLNRRAKKQHPLQQQILPTADHPMEFQEEFIRQQPAAMAV